VDLQIGSIQGYFTVHGTVPVDLPFVSHEIVEKERPHGAMVGQISGAFINWYSVGQFGSHLVSGCSEYMTRTVRSGSAFFEKDFCLVQSVT
jgi:hypothetical protein